MANKLHERIMKLAAKETPPYFKLEFLDLKISLTAFDHGPLWYIHVMARYSQDLKSVNTRLILEQEFIAETDEDYSKVLGFGKDKFSEPSFRSIPI